MKKKSICFYSISTHLGGAERSLLDLLGQLAKDNNYTIRLLLPKSSGPLFAELEKLGVRSDVVKMPELFFRTSRESPLRSILFFLLSLPSLLVYICRLNDYFKENFFDIVHTTGIKCHFLVFFVRPLRAKLVLHLRDIFTPGFTRFTLHLIWKIFGWNSIVLANSSATANSFSSSSEVRVIYNGINSDYFFPNKNNLIHQELGIEPGSPIIGILGALAKWKGQKEFILMAKELLTVNSSPVFVIIGDQIYDTDGDAGYLSELKDLVNSLGLNNKIFFLGFRKDTNTILNSLSVLVHASIRPEPFGRVIIEAQACGVPVVASAAGGVLELVNDGVSGLLFPPGNIQVMADSVNRFLMDESFKMAVIEAGRKKVDQEFTLSSHIQRVTQIYQE